MNGMKGINHKIQQLIKKLPLPSNWKFWLALALLVKTIFFIFKILEPGESYNYYPQVFALGGGDSNSYIQPIENLLTNGSYYDDYRMPGYGWLYFVLRLMLPMTGALNMMVIIQLILSAISVYVLALIARKIFQRDSCFYVCFFLYLISTFVSLYDYQLLTESFCTSALIFSTYFLLTANEAKGKLLLSGLFLTWSIFLRPVMAPILLIFGIYFFFKIERKKTGPSSSQWSKLFVFMIPLILIDGSWVLRNYCKYKEVIPLTRSVFYPGFEKTYMSSMN